jgi:hypothetical protein
MCIALPNQFFDWSADSRILLADVQLGDFCPGAFPGVCNCKADSNLTGAVPGGSILSLKPDTVVRKLIEHRLAPQTAQESVDLLNEIDWCHTQLPPRQWRKGIRNFYYGKS